MTDYNIFPKTFLNKGKYALNIKDTYTTQTKEMHNFINQYLISDVSYMLRTCRLLTPMHVQQTILHIQMSP